MKLHNWLFTMLAFVMLACGDGRKTIIEPPPPPPPPPVGEAKFGIISGNGQIVAIGQNLKPVVAKLARANGTVSLRILPLKLVGTAYAQMTDTVQGAPIVGEIVCHADKTTQPRLVPFSVCVKTDSAGRAVFNYTTTAEIGDAKAEIHWDSAGKPIVTDSVYARVTAGSIIWTRVLQQSVWTQADSAHLPSGWYVAGGYDPSRSDPVYSSNVAFIGEIAYDAYENRIPLHVTVASGPWITLTTDTLMHYPDGTSQYVSLLQLSPSRVRGDTASLRFWRDDNGVRTLVLETKITYAEYGAFFGRQPLMWYLLSAPRVVNFTCVPAFNRPCS